MSCQARRRASRAAIMRLAYPTTRPVSVVDRDEERVLRDRGAGRRRGRGTRRGRRRPSARRRRDVGEGLEGDGMDTRRPGRAAARGSVSSIPARRHDGRGGEAGELEPDGLGALELREAAMGEEGDALGAILDAAASRSSVLPADLGRVGDGAQEPLADALPARLGQDGDRAPERRVLRRVDVDPADRRGTDGSAVELGEAAAVAPGYVALAPVDLVERGRVVGLVALTIVGESLEVRVGRSSSRIVELGLAGRAGHPSASRSGSATSRATASTPAAPSRGRHAEDHLGGAALDRLERLAQRPPAVVRRSSRSGPGRRCRTSPDRGRSPRGRRGSRRASR